MIHPIQTIEYHDEISSTNDRIQELLRLPVKPPLPCLVIAKRQTAGRGRGNKRWWSGEGAILMSLGFELSPTLESSNALDRDQLPMLSVATGQAVIRVLSRHLPQHNLELHLPNDVYVDGKKICGILLESPTPQYAILGIGLNVNNRLCDIPPEFADDLASRSITSMIELLGKETDIDRLIEELLNEFLDIPPRTRYHDPKLRSNPYGTPIH